MLSWLPVPQIKSILPTDPCPKKAHGGYGVGKSVRPQEEMTARLGWKMIILQVPERGTRHATHDHRGKHQCDQETEDRSERKG